MRKKSSVYTELVKDGFVFYEGKERNCSMETMEEAADFAASFFNKKNKIKNRSQRL